MQKIFLFTLLGLSLTAFAQQPIQNFSILNVGDNSPVALESFQSCSGLVVPFTSNDCAYDGYYTSRVKSLINAYKGKIQFLLVNSYTEPNEAADKMKIKYDAWALGVPYLADKDQTAMECLSAKKSPEVFLLKNTGGKYVLAYSGAIDDNPQVANDVKQNYLKEAIDKLLAGQKIEVANVRAVGCSVRRK
ncbi:MAG TPA: thioredoxin family protein [Cyclobacteriaceae bacterium]